mmetsp:Transcript_16490/g.46041  ORF Transcript_16490/g.46041 Transcript_16490/m.46041 type:complete len:87 (-) Transcript_16490:406-666(-)
MTNAAGNHHLPHTQEQPDKQRRMVIRSMLLALLLSWRGEDYPRRTMFLLLPHTPRTMDIEMECCKTPRCSSNSSNNINININHSDR